MTRQEVAALRSLARLRGVLTSYQDVAGERRSAAPQTLLAVLQAMGEPLGSAREAPAALRRAREELDREMVPPVIVDWKGARSSVGLRPPPAASRGAGARGRRLECTLTLEDGEVRTWRQQAGAALSLPPDLPVGRHHLTLRIGRHEAGSWVLTAPPRVGTAHIIPGRPRDVGVFLPLYALRTPRSWGAGDLTDLEDFARWAGGHGATIVGTLPLLAGYFEEPFEPSPYAPISRLFFSELYLDPASSADVALSLEARELLGSAELQRELEELRNDPLVDYRRLARTKRRVLELLARAAFDTPQRRRELDRFARASPEAADFAAFRATADRTRSTWQSWADAAREGKLRRGRDYDVAAAQYHLYCQALLGEQLGELSETLRRSGSVLYLDLPIGVSGGGYDVWRYRESFATGVSVGAPPDTFFSSGQDWGFPPILPRQSRLDGHDYFARCLRAHLAHTGLLRLDHVMALHRLYWVPRGMPAKDGAYVRYPEEELFATLSIEAHRAAQAGESGVRIVGENLGTVPAAVNRAMERRRVLGMYIGQFAFTTARMPIPEPPAETLAALNTHDTPTFAAFYSGLDLRLRRELSIADERATKREGAARAKLRAALDRFAARAGLPGPAPEERADPARAALRAALERLAASPAAVVLLNLEDLWLETLPQNVPGTAGDTFPNWRRKAAYALDEFDGLPGLADLLRDVAALRLTPLPAVVAEPRTAAAEAGAPPTASRGRGPRGRSGAGA